jgi:hypothetical protein
MKMTEINVEKMSSVNCVKKFTTLEVEKTDANNNMPADHKPVHAYTGRKGIPLDWHVAYSTFKKASRGPVVPIIVRGCAENMA